MDPYLEGYLWPDVHHNLASAIQELPARQISPKYVARVSLIKDPLPVLPVPLKKPDEDAQLDLREALDKIYERNLYHLSTSYEEAPPAPPFTEAEQAWMRKLLDDFLRREGYG